MKNKRGEIATLLTLGLVILGGVLAIGSSVFLSKQKTTSTRAAGITCDATNNYNCSGVTATCADGTACGQTSINTGNGSCSRCMGPNCQRKQSSTVYSFPVFDLVDSSQCSEGGGDGAAAQPGDQPAAVPASSELGPDPECESAAGNYAWGPADICYIVGGSNRGGYCANKAISSQAPCCAVMPNSNRLCCQGLQGEISNFLKANPSYKNTFSQKADIYGLSCKDEILKSSEAVAIPPAASSNDKPRDRCNDYGSALACSKGCRLEEDSHLCVKGKVSGVKKWCCPPAPASPPAATNTCLDQNKKNDGNIYKCINNIQVDEKGKYDAKKSCSVGFTGSSYASSFSCGNNYQVCCKKTTPPPPAGGSVPKSGVQPQDEAPPIGTSEEETPAQIKTGGGKTCQVNKTNLSVSGKDISIENNNDLWNNVPCNHIFLTSVNDISVFRECPTFIQGKSCVYSCYKGTEQVNCQKVRDVITSKRSITFINKKNNNIWIKTAVETPSTEIILTETEIPISKYVQGFFSCVGSTGVTIKYLYKESKNGEYTSYDIESPSCKSLLVYIQ